MTVMIVIQILNCYILEIFFFRAYFSLFFFISSKTSYLRDKNSKIWIKGKRKQKKCECTRATSSSIARAGQSTRATASWRPRSRSANGQIFAIFLFRRQLLVKDAFVFGNIKFRDKISNIFSRKYRFFAKKSIRICYFNLFCCVLRDFEHFKMSSVDTCSPIFSEWFFFKYLFVIVCSFDWKYK